MHLLHEQPVEVGKLTFKPYLSQAAISECVKRLGAAIAKDYADKNPVFLVVLNGAFVFAADLVRACPIDCQTLFVRLKSYEGTSSGGRVRTMLPIEEDLTDRHLIIVEDIIDTGATMHHFIQQLQSKQPASVRLVSLLFKPQALQEDIKIDYLGFEILNKFVVGYGLDYNEQGRNLPAIYQLAE